MKGSPRARFAFLVLAGLVFSPEVESAAGPPVQFFYQERAECHFANGTGPGGEKPSVRYLLRHIYDRQDLLHFDSALGRYVALSPLAESNAERLNRDLDMLRNLRAEVDRFCRHNYGILEPFIILRKIQPKLKITPTEYDSSSRNTVLICFVDSFFSAKIKITWLRNGKEEEGSKVMTTDLIQNGDWTFQIQVMLETQPERGDVYACQVEHASFTSPASVEWRPQSDSARSKMWTGVVGIVLGVVFVAAGFSLYLRKDKGLAAPLTTVGLMD